MLDALRRYIRRQTLGAEEARQTPRFSVLLPALVICRGQALPVELLDLSRGGALARGSAPRKRGEMLWLRANGAETPARVAWARANKFGMAFTVQLTTAQLETMLAAHFTPQPSDSRN